MIDTAMFIFCLVVVLIFGIAIGYLIGYRHGFHTAKPNVPRAARKYWPYLDLYHRIQGSELFADDEKALLGVMIDDFVKENM